MADSQYRIRFFRVDEDFREQGRSFELRVSPSLTTQELTDAVKAKSSKLQAFDDDELIILKLEKPVAMFTRRSNRRSNRLAAASAQLNPVPEEASPQTNAEETGPGSVTELLESMRKQGIGRRVDQYDYVFPLDDELDTVGDCFENNLPGKVQALVLHPVLPERQRAGEWCALDPQIFL